MKRTGIFFWIALLLTFCSGMSSRQRSSDGASVPKNSELCRTDLKLSEEECRQWQKTVLPEKLPSSPGNKQADDGRAAMLGFKAFFDPRFSPQLVQCVSCHTPEDAFTERKPFSRGIGDVTRNAPSLLNSARMRWLFWDGRADSLWAQPLFTIEHPKEMHESRLEAAHSLFKNRKDDYEAIFGKMPDLSDLKRFPPVGSPGSKAFDRMKKEDQKAVNRVFANLGKSFEAYIRKLAAGKSPVDRYLEGEKEAITPEAKQGMAVFTRARCFACHGGPMFSDDKFHNLGVAAWPGVAPDRGRAQGRKDLIGNIFNAKGEFWDAALPNVVAVESLWEGDSEDLLGAIHTPSLRNVAKTAPYGHNGRFAKLEDVVEFHLRGGGLDGKGFVGKLDPLLKPVQLTETEKKELLAFLGALTGKSPSQPWNNWPYR
jgi:cytochrome c peroxidase